MDGLLKYSEAKSIKLESLSLGQGQGAKAEKLIADATKSGRGWCCRTAIWRCLG